MLTFTLLERGLVVGDRTNISVFKALASISTSMSIIFLR